MLIERIAVLLYHVNPLRATAQKKIPSGIDVLEQRAVPMIVPRLLLAEVAGVELVTSGEQKGREAGLIEGQRLLVERQLIRKLGSRSDPLHAQIEPLTLSQLTALGEALLDFTTPADLEAWLAAPPTPVDDDQSSATES